jgi:hypothetical protein
MHRLSTIAETVTPASRARPARLAGFPAGTKPPTYSTIYVNRSEPARGRRNGATLPRTRASWSTPAGDKTLLQQGETVEIEALLD